jgi:hypothetical protein
MSKETIIGNVINVETKILLEIIYYEYTLPSTFKANFQLGVPDFASGVVWC